MNRRRLLGVGLLMILIGNSLTALGRVTDTPAQFIAGWLAIWTVSGLAFWAIWHHTRSADR